MKNIIWELPFFRHSNNIQVTAWYCKHLIAKTVDEVHHKNKSRKSYLGNKNKYCFQLLLDRTHTLFMLIHFSACTIGRASKFMRARKIGRDETSPAPKEHQIAASKLQNVYCQMSRKSFKALDFRKSLKKL